MATKTTETTKRQIRNPQKWVGKVVLHMDYYEWKWGDRGYFVCEWSGRLYRNDNMWSPIDETELELAESNGYDPCFCYSNEAVVKVLAA